MEKLATGPLKAKSASLIVALGVTVGFSIDRLAMGQRVGLGFATAMLLFVACVWRMSARRRPEVLALLVGAAVLIGWTAIRAAGYMAAINTIAAVALISLAVTAWAFDPRVWLLPVVAHVQSLIDQAISMIAGAAKPVGVVASSRSQVDVSRAMPFIRGALFAIPVFGLFAILLASADSVFSGFLGDLVPKPPASIGSTLGHTAFILMLAWLVAGYLAFAWEPPHASAAESGELRPRGDRFVEVMVVLSSVAALFALFVAFQFAYMFGGSRQAVAGGTTYAEYARQGFFQLLAVSVLTAVLVWVSMLWLRPLTGRRRALFRSVCAAMVLLTGVILASALKRLGLYEEAYGYTRLRVLSHAFTYLIAGMLVVLVVQVFLDRDGLVPAGAVALGFVVLFGLNLINPDAYIAGRNIDRASAVNPSWDLHYVTGLSADAVPVTAARLDELAPRQRAQMRRWICGTVEQPRSVREWNLGASRAEAAADQAAIGRFSPECRP